MTSENEMILILNVLPNDGGISTLKHLPDFISTKAASYYVHRNSQ